ncbi:dynein regulatory complex subunit 3 isoform X1 [Meleagris gallopavo]|uniref:Dynein regulatory complex subunit 3 n=1 Tax=Meleagris gallopavo TaxID=9103 RepID=G1MZH6_MELGA|nr:dynein regulatory complex subunit 3 isoform X1 [Meleagris gallopavo]XP_019476097.1 dynein regulatory complex subunit 3 isoform X1 [Meleagris gallopavo]XP_019476098.1 dynein regulatory complex subunit 3 isoform X1 [Meleagris gallopavo]
MSQSDNSFEPNVIDDEMLQKAVEEQWPEDIRKLAKAEGINFKDVMELQLSFRNILQIDNLWQFEYLTKLQLDNNIIEKIEALESLVHLVWLDLSFNNIEVIEGLDTLVKLQDLSLYNNRISKIEHMDTLQELQIFSIGKNNLTALENVVYLRRFKNLHTLNLTGNPLCDEEQYMLFVVAHLPDLVYLDFKLVSDTTREVAISNYHYLTDLLEHEEAQALAQLEEKQAQQKELEYHKTAFVEYLNGSFLFDSLYAEDTEAAKLAYLPGVDDLLQAYRKDFVSVCENLFNYCLKEHEKREAEVSDFYEGLHEVLTANQEEGRRIILDFENQNKTRLDEIHHASSHDTAESMRAEYNEDILQLSETLMTLEMQMVDQLEELIKEFERNIAVIASTFTENVKGMMTQCRDLENRHHEKLLEISISALEKSLKDELNEELPDDVREFLGDKNTIVNMVNKSHKIHLLKISMRECDILLNMYRWEASVKEKALQNEIDRNRNRVKEIFQYIDDLQEQLDNTQIPELTE